MRQFLFSLALGISALSATAHAEVGPPCYVRPAQPWYISHPANVKTFKQALSEEQAFLTKGNPGYKMAGNAETCAALSAVGVACDYNTRGMLSMFLTVNGKGLFPAAGRTNPYFSKHDTSFYDRPDDYFVGQPKQNAMLVAAVLKNAALFKDGDLTAADVRKNWK